MSKSIEKPVVLLCSGWLGCPKVLKTFGFLVVGMSRVSEIIENTFGFLVF